MSTSILDYKPSGLSNLDPEFKELWISWLRYGNLRQVKGCLKRKREDGRIGYCCLGVAADCVDPNGWGKYYNISLTNPSPIILRGKLFLSHKRFYIKSVFITKTKTR